MEMKEILCAWGSCLYDLQIRRVIGNNTPGVISDLALVALVSRPSTIIERVMTSGIARVTSSGGQNRVGSGRRES